MSTCWWTTKCSLWLKVTQKLIRNWHFSRPLGESRRVLLRSMVSRLFWSSWAEPPANSAVLKTFTLPPDIFKTKCPLCFSLKSDISLKIKIFLSEDILSLKSDIYSPNSDLNTKFWILLTEFDLISLNSEPLFFHNYDFRSRFQLFCLQDLIFHCIFPSQFWNRFKYILNEQKYIQSQNFTITVMEWTLSGQSRLNLTLSKFSSIEKK